MSTRRRISLFELHVFVKTGALASATLMQTICLD
jgi:hypothetical protein